MDPGFAFRTVMAGEGGARVKPLKRRDAQSCNANPDYSKRSVPFILASPGSTSVLRDVIGVKCQSGRAIQVKNSQSGVGADRRPRVCAHYVVHEVSLRS